MTVRKLDENGDIVTNGTLFLTERDEVAQTIKTRLRLFMGEYFRNINEGTPWFQSVFSKSTTNSVKESAIKRVISNTPDVVRILSFETDYQVSTRSWSVTAVVLSSFGEIELSTTGDITSG